jgi:hypothetical protein
MKIVGRLLTALFCAVTAASIAVVGCSSTNNYNAGEGTSKIGESCTRSFDCKSGLVCVANTCFPAAVADASTGDSGDAATTSTGPHLGLLNESCQRTSDCENPLECVGLRCSVVSYGLTATGKSCSGECNTAADCCELPVGFSPSLSYWYSDLDAGDVFHNSLFTGSVRCEDLLAYIGGNTSACSATTTIANYPSLGAGCFYYQTYCAACMASNPWACTANKCSYAAPCTTSTVSVGGCPSETRTARALSTTCNIAPAAASGTCSAGCSTTADCDGKIPSGSGHACSAADAGGENCTCYQSACYFKCSKDIDCASGYACDATTSLCKTAGCTTDQNCITSTGNPRATCAAGQCQIQCQSDVECGPPSNICSAGTCKPSGCTADSDCSSTAHAFCVTAPTAATTYTSAVTN